MPPGSTGGSVYVYDPVFCDVSVDKGTGDRWFSGTNGGQLVLRALQHAEHALRHHRRHPGRHVGRRCSSRSRRRTRRWVAAAAPSASTAPTAPYGDGRDYHDRWYRLYTGLTGGAERDGLPAPHDARPTRRTWPSSATRTARAASRSTPAPAAARRRIYGLGAMQMFTPLSASGGSTVLRVLPGPDRRGPRRQDDGDQALGPGRHEPARGQPPDRDPDRRRLDRRRPSTGRPPVGTTNSGAAELRRAQRDAACLVGPDERRQHRPAPSTAAG